MKEFSSDQGHLLGKGPVVLDVLDAEVSEWAKKHFKSGVGSAVVNDHPFISRRPAAAEWIRKPVSCINSLWASFIVGFRPQGLARRRYGAKMREKRRHNLTIMMFTRRSQSTSEGMNSGCTATTAGNGFCMASSKSSTPRSQSARCDDADFPNEWFKIS